MSIASRCPTARRASLPSARAPNIMKGYWNKPNETKAVLEERLVLFRRTAPIMDDEGFVYIVDRLKGP